MTDTPANEFALFGDRLECALARVSMSQTALAHRLGTTPQNISFLVNGATRLYRGEHGQELADILNVAVDWLLRNAGLPPQDMPRPSELPRPTRPRKNNTRRLKALDKLEHARKQRPAETHSLAQSPNTSGLGFLQKAVLEKLVSAMRAGDFSEKECLQLLTRLDEDSTKD